MEVKMLSLVILLVSILEAANILFPAYWASIF